MSNGVPVYGPHAYPSQTAVTERLLRESSVSYTIVGPTYFYDNLLGGLDGIRGGRLDLLLPVDTPLQQLSRRDLGRFVALVFDDPDRFARTRIDLASDDPTPRRMAEVLGEVLGTPVQAHASDADAIASPDMRAMFRFLTDTGYDANIGELRRLYPEVGWQSFADWAAELA